MVATEPRLSTIPPGKEMSVSELPFLLSCFAPHVLPGIVLIGCLLNFPSVGQEIFGNITDLGNKIDQVTALGLLVGDLSS